MSNPHEHLPDVSTVNPVDLAREAVLHHAGANALAVHGSRPYDTRDMYRAEQPIGDRWVAVQSAGWPTEVRIMWPDGQARHDRGGQVIARVTLGEDGTPAIATCLTQGKAEIEWAHAALIARMREREPIIAAECVRLADELKRWQNRAEHLAAVVDDLDTAREPGYEQLAAAALARAREVVETAPDGSGLVWR